MKIDRVLEQLKEAGYKVRVFHERATNADVEMAIALRDSGDKLAFPQFMANKTELPQGEISPYGGKTIAMILRGEGDGEEEVARGVAICAPIDPFNRRVGTSKALGRAISKLREVDQNLAVSTGKG